MLTYCAAMAALDPTDLLDLYWAGRTTMVTRREQIPVYDKVFRRFFLDEDDGRRALVEGHHQGGDTDASRRCRSLPPSRAVNGQDEEAKLGLLASDADVLRNKSFARARPRSWPRCGAS